MNNITKRLENIKKLQAKRWDNEEEYWDEISDLLLKELEEILQIEPENTVALINLGTIYSDLGENEKAMYCLKQALKLGSEDKNLYINLAIVMVGMGMHAEEYHEYLEIAEDKEEDPLTFKAYFDPQSH
ncbi:tetratricopeptide repeat protein [Chryseobacterium sp. Y16C]|uniref:tetratricopeptide repeat protein n=1 Tax=Chryseobacterium sp. Y16C TaxID=2920939 RepID=UPI001F0CD680|nr:tetratricopeptide repeat protein [Chryseobacterium sp. Y16C]UMQ43865.1 tetratricopeptide repeat protein [Chryseobacterium sp. Y16C]